MIWTDVKQSEGWGKYLESFGWKIVHADCGANIAIIHSLFGNLVKIQHPPVFDQAGFDKIEDICKKNKAALVKLEPFVGQDESIILAGGYIKSLSPHCCPSTIVIDLSKTKEELWNTVSHSGKYAVNRARREGDYVKFYPNPQDDVLRPYYKMCRRTGFVKRFYVQPYKELVDRAKLFGDKAILAIVYNKNNEMVSGKFYLGDGYTTLYVTGGTTDAGRKERGGFLLMWESFLYLKDAGYKVLDLEGTTDPRFPVFTKRWGGFAHFKEKFGGETIRFPLPYVKFNSLLMKFFGLVMGPMM